MRSLLSLNRSFVPVLLVLITIYMLLLNIHLQALSSADRVTIIHIQSGPDGFADNPGELGSEGELDAYLDKTYLVGVEHLAERKLEEVNRTISKLQDDNKTQLARLLQGRLAMVTGDHDAALRLFNDIAGNGETPLSAFFFRAKTYNRLDQPELAILDYDRVLASNPNHFSANFNRGLLLYNLGDYERAAGGFEQAATLAGGARKARSYSKLAKCQYKLSRLEQSEQSANEALRFSPGLIEARMTLGKIHIARGQFEEALAEYDRVKSLGPDDASTFASLAKFYQRHGRPQSAELMFHQAIQHKPGSKKLRMALAQLLSQQKRWIEAGEQYRSIIKSDPRDSDAYFQLGRIAHTQKNYQDSLEYYHKVIDLKQGKSPESWFNIGLVYKSTKDYTSALQAYDTATGIDEGYYEAWFNKALANFKLGQLEQARLNLEKAISINPEYSRAWYNLGIVRAKQGQDTEAIDAYRKALEIKPDYYSAKLNLAVRYSKQENYQFAEQLYREVLQAKPYYKTAWYNLGVALVRQQKTEDAIPIFEKVLEIDAGHYRSYSQLAKIYYSHEQYDKAIEYLKHALDIKPDSARIRLMLANTYFQLKQFEDALKVARQVVALKPEDRDIQKLIPKIESNLNPATE